jgi:predicted 3-demethylubiquinone-9 3-methyltransferase (glyoxalase superfamily)
MDSAHPHNFAFNEAISFIVDCQDQKEVDHFWEKLTADGGEESMCGWLKDRYGVSWQIVPSVLPELIAGADKEKAGRAMRAMLQMKKIDISKLQEAYAG